MEAVSLGENSAKKVVVLQGDADYNDTKRVLSVNNRSESTNIHVKKVWQCDNVYQKEITLQLLANDHRVTTLFPSLESVAEIKLNSGNKWTYTWENMPLYADGSPIKWSVQETRIGTDRIRDNGTFLNYVVSYTSRLADNGDTDITVTNALRQASLYVTKTNIDGSHAVAGATYRLEKLMEVPDAPGTYQVDPSFVQQQITSDHSGQMLFKGIQYGRYRLTEVNAPDGYYLSGPVELLLNEDGSVTVISGDASYNDVAYNITVQDLEHFQLPSTGSIGIFGLVHALFGVLAGVMLVMLALEWRWKAAKR